MPANNPNSPNAQTIQGPGPTGNEGYPVAVVPATGSDPFPVTISGGGGGAVTIADGADVCEGATTDAANTTGTSGTVSGKLRGLVQLIAAATDIANSRFRVFIQNATLAVTQSGAWTVAVSNFPASQPVTGTVTANQGTPAAKSFANSWPVQVAASQGVVLARTVNNSSAVPNPTIDQAGNQVNHIVYPYLYSGKNGASTFFEMSLTPRVYKTVQANAAGNTALWAPTAGTKFRLMRYKITVTGDASFAIAAVLVVSLFDAAAGVTGQAEDFYVPLVAGIVPGNFTTGWIDLGTGYLSALANNVLNVNLSAALATGNVRVVCCGIEE